MEFIMLLLLFTLAITGCHGNELEVDYLIPDKQQVIYDVPLQREHEIHKRSPSQPLRIHLHFDTSVDRLPYEHQTLIKGKVYDAVAFWEDTLMVHPTSSPILLNRKCMRDTVRYYDGVRYCTGGCAATTRCGDITVPTSHLRSCQWYDSVANEYFSPRDTMPGVNTSFILYVAALSSDKCSWQKTVAFAAHCQQEQHLDRPVAGYFSICPGSVSTSIHKHEELLYTIKHEILHALGFTAGLYAFYRDKWGRPLTERERLTGKPLVFDKNAGMYMWSDRVVKQYSRYAWKLKGQTIEKKVNMIITPNVVREVRDHFNCDSLEGGELEDQGGINGTAITHWEKRVFENEFMTGTYTQNPIISRISLALMEDTGWYSVKYNNAKTLEWGKNLGCDFATKSCYEWIETKLSRNEDIHPFCIEATLGQPVTDCSKNRKAVAICNLSEFDRDLPSQYQYFRSIPGVPSYKVGRFGGSVALADYCPYLQEFVWKQDSDFIRGSRCALVQNTLEPSQNYLLEKYSPRSKCFNHGSGWALQKCRNGFIPHSGSGCYEYECRSDTGLLIYVMERGYRCYYAGQVLTIEYADNQWLYRGNITCPSCVEICQKQEEKMPSDQISYSEKYCDEKYEYRHVILPPDISKLVPKNHLMTETEWRNLGVQQSPGWIHYMVHSPEPHVLLFRRALPGTQAGSLGQGQQQVAAH